jgi:hypothetical protein
VSTSGVAKAAALPQSTIAASIALGIVVGVAYALSPLSLWSSAAFAALVWWIGRDLPAPEARRVRIVLLVAIVVRVAAIAGLFVITDHGQIPFGSFFGDEEYFIRRSTWLRNVAIGIPIHGADLIYAFDEFGYTHYLYVIAFLQVLTGLAPYGLHMVSAVAYLGGAIVLFRLARRAYGPGVALAGLLVLLFLPSLFAWSIAALKEPPYFLLSASTAAVAVAVVRTRQWHRRIAGLIFLVAAAAGLQAIREGGLPIAIAGIAGGWTIAWLAERPRASLAAAIVAPILIIGAMSRPDVQVRVVQEVRRAARVHWGHINTAGVVYKTLDDRLYAEKDTIDGMSRGETWRFLIRSTVDYLTVPQPWTIQSRAALAFMPELLFWYAIVALAPFGFVAALRRDALVTGVLAAWCIASAALVAVTSGNVGTLIRHRGLALPFLIWLSAAGADALLSRAARPATDPQKELACP